MVRKTSIGDWIQLGILLVTGLGTIGAFSAYNEGHFATKDALEVEVQERREMKAEIDQIYGKMIPQAQQSTLHYHRKIN